MKRQVSEKIQKISDGILAMAGIFSSPNPGARAAGNSKSGQSVFVSDKAAQSSDINAGAGLLHVLRMFVEPFHVLTKKEKEGMDELIKTASDNKLITALDNDHVNRNGEAFSVKLIRAIGAPTSHALAVVTALKLYDHWGVISTAQKSLAIAAMGVQLHKTDKNGAICDLKIIDGKDQSFTVKDALDMVQQGKNPYPLVQNWTQIYDLARVYNDRPSTENLEDFASSHGLLGKGAGDAAIPGVSHRLIQAANAKPAPQYGVGAIAAPAGSKPPQGYATAAASQQGSIIVPQANASSAAGALQGSLVGTKAGAGGSSSDAAATYSKWDKKEAKTKDKGALGGSAFVAGLTALKQSSPYLYSAMVAFLAKFSHDKIDSSNPAKYFAALAGVSLARIVAGKSEEKADKEGSALAQSVGEATTPGDYAKLQVNMRGLYANFGIASKADAYQLSNQAYSEGRIDESSLVAMHEIYNLVYDDHSTQLLTKLLGGKDKGLEIARNPSPEIHNTMTIGQSKNHEAVLEQMTKDELRRRNAARYAKQQQAEAKEAAPDQETASDESQESASAPEQQSQPSAMGA